MEIWCAASGEDLIQLAGAVDLPSNMALSPQVGPAVRVLCRAARPVPHRASAKRVYQCARGGCYLVTKPGRDSTFAPVAVPDDTGGFAVASVAL